MEAAASGGAGSRQHGACGPAPSARADTVPRVAAHLHATHSSTHAPTVLQRAWSVLHSPGPSAAAAAPRLPRDLQSASLQPSVVFARSRSEGSGRTILNFEHRIRI